MAPFVIKRASLAACVLRIATWYFFQYQGDGDNLVEQLLYTVWQVWPLLVQLASGLSPCCRHRHSCTRMDEVGLKTFYFTCFCFEILFKSKLAHSMFWILFFIIVAEIFLLVFCICWACCWRTTQTGSPSQSVSLKIFPEIVIPTKTATWPGVDFHIPAPGGDVRVSQFMHGLVTICLRHWFKSFPQQQE